MGASDEKSKPRRLVPVDKPRGAPRRTPGAGEVQVPVGLEILLFEAARDEAFKQRLLDDRLAAAQAHGVELRAAERATLQAISSGALAGMIDRLVPNNPRGRNFMGKVAIAVTTLAAGTVGSLTVGCESDRNLEGGAGPDCYGDGCTTSTTTSSGGAGGTGGAGGQGALGGAGGDAGAGGDGGSGGG